MSMLAAIIVFSLLMNTVALSGSQMLVAKGSTLDRWLPLLVALASGALLGGALFHNFPAALGTADSRTPPRFAATAVWCLSMVILFAASLIH